MRTNTTKSFTIALAMTILLAVPTFAARDDAKHQPRQQPQQEQSLIQRVVNRLKKAFDLPIVPIPTSSISDSDH